MTGQKDIVNTPSRFFIIIHIVYTTTNKPSGFGKLKDKCMSAREVERRNKWNKTHDKLVKV